MGYCTLLRGDYNGDGYFDQGYFNLPQGEAMKKIHLPLILLLFGALISPSFAADTAPENTGDTKTDKEWERKVDDIDRQLDKLEEELSKARKNTQAEFKKKIPQLRERQQELKEKFSDLQKTGGEAWKEVAEGAQKALEELNRALERAQTRFQEEGAK